MRVVLGSLATVAIATASLLSLEDVAHLGFYNYEAVSGYHVGETGTRNSILIRLLFLASFLTTVVAVSSICRRNPKVCLDLWHWFTKGTIAASLIGIAIFALVAVGKINYDWLDSVSAGYHVVEVAGLDFYRFNPGANVNQFGKYAAIALAYTVGVRLNIPFRRVATAILIFALIAALGRSAWVGVVVALGAVAVHARLTKTTLGALVLGIAVTAIALSAFCIFVPESVQEMIATRLVMSPGPGGSERIIKVTHVLNSLMEADLFTIFFGFGWGTNLYVHSVPFQILYETGLIGFILGTCALAHLWWKLHIQHRGVSRHLTFLRAILAIITIDMLLQHSIYHLSTWLVIASVLAYASPLTNLDRSHKSHDNYSLC